jgi:hypothetical protein
MELSYNLMYYLKDEVPDIDQAWFLEKYMTSTVRRQIDQCNPLFVNAPSYVIREKALTEFGDYQKKDDEFDIGYTMISYWYNLYQYVYNVASVEIIKRFPLQWMDKRHAYYHQLSEWRVVECMHEWYLRL